MGFAVWLLYLTLLLVRPQEFSPVLVGYPIMDVLGGLAALGMAVSWALGDRPRPSWVQLLAGIGFLLWSAFSVAAAVRWFGGAVDRLFQQSISFYVFILVAFNVFGRRRLAVSVSVACACLLAVLGMSLSAFYSGAQQSRFFVVAEARGALDMALDAPEIVTESGQALEEGVAEETDRPRDRQYVKRIQGLGSLNDPNDFAQALVAIIPLVFLAWRERRWLSNLVLVVAPSFVLVWGVLLTRSRGGLLSLLALLPMAALLRMPPKWRAPTSIVLGVAAIPGIALLFGYALRDGSALGRIEAWSAGLQMLRFSPIWGVGSGFFGDHHERVAHNSFVQCFAETGLVGYFLWLSLIVLSLGQMSHLALNSTRPEWVRWARAVQLSLLSFLFSALFLSRTTSPMLFLLTGLTAAVASSARLDGEDVPIPRAWPQQVLGLEIASILVVWLTMRVAR